MNHILKELIFDLVFARGNTKRKGGEGGVELESEKYKRLTWLQSMGTHIGERCYGGGVSTTHPEKETGFGPVRQEMTPSCCCHVGAVRA